MPRDAGGGIILEESGRQIPKMLFEEQIQAPTRYEQRQKAEVDTRVIYEDGGVDRNRDASANADVKWKGRQRQVPRPDAREIGKNNWGTQLLI